MTFKLENKHLEITLDGNLNYVAAQEIEPLTSQARKVTIDLSNARIIDSEGVILLFTIVRRGKILRLKNPPAIIEELIPALGLQEVLRLEELTG